MELTKDNVLLKSNHGQNFYQLVLGSQLIITGNKSKAIANPFYNDTKASLSIYFRYGQWLFKDFGNPVYSGDVFHFAAYYYKLDSAKDFVEILKRLNQELNLGLESFSNNKLAAQLKAIQLNAKQKANDYLKGRGIQKKKGFYQTNPYQNEPAAIVFINHNQSGFEKRFIATELELKQLNLPKTKYIGVKQNSLYIDVYNKNKERVFICEGVINALSFAEIGESAIATFGVGNLPSAQMFSKFIENKIVYLAGDGDLAGREFNSTLISLISEGNIATQKIYRLDFPDKKDANDLLREAQLENYSQYRTIVLAHYDYSKIIKTESYSELFPIDVFSTNQKSLILELNRTLNFPINYSAASILAAASTAIGKSVKIKVQNGWYEQASIYMILCGRSGINKSHPLEFALKPIFKYDESKTNEYELAYEQYEQVADLTSKEKRELGLTDVKEPILNQVLVNDITPEALQVVHSKNPRGLGLYRDEILGWINSFDRYSSSGELQLWLSLWSGTNVRTNRTGRKAIFLAQPFVSVFGTIQSARLEDLSKGNMSLTGFTDRILFTFSEVNKKAYMNESELSDRYIAYYECMINKLLKLPLEMNEQGQVQSMILSFSGRSKELLLEWNRYNADMSNKAFTSELERSIYAKLDSYFARFVLILQMLNWADGEADIIEIKPEIVENAMELIEYYRKNAIYASKLIYNSSDTQSEKLDEKHVAKFLSSKKKSIREIGEILGKGKSTIADWLKK